MSNARHIGRVGALAVALGVTNVRRAATRMTLSIGAAAVVVTATAVPAPVSPAMRLSVDSTALVMCATTCPTADAYVVDTVMNQFITPTHSGQTITPVAVTTPEELWPSTGILRLIGSVTGDPKMLGPGGAAWPDEPWWKLSGLFDLTADQSVQAGVADLEAAMAAHGNDHLVIFGASQGAFIANKEKRKLAEQYPPGTTAPDIDFVLLGDPNVPNGGLNSRFPGLPTVILGTFDGPELTDTQFHTDVINRQYDMAADFPLYPLNVVADLNAVLGFFYLHTNLFDVSLPTDPTTSPAYQGTHGDSSYYFFPTADLPLFAPLRQLGVPEALIDVVEPFFRAIVELGYDRTIPPWEPTPARLIPATLNPAKVATDLLNAIGDGINNAAALIGSPPPLSIPAPVTLAAPATETAKADISHQVTATDTLTQTEQVTSTGTAVANMVTAAGPPVSTATQKQADPASGTETVQADVSPQVTPTETVTETSHLTSTKKVTETAEANEASTGPRATPNPSVSASTPKPAKPAGQPATPRPVVRGSLGVGEQLRDLPHRGNGGRQTTRTSAADDEAATVGPSSVASSSAASSSTGSNSSGGDSSGGS
jgi:hypothetical protein